MDNEKNLKWKFFGLNSFREVYKGLVLLFQSQCHVLRMIKLSENLIEDLKKRF